MPRVTITIADRNPQPYRFQLDRMKVNMGRGSDNDIVIDDGSASVRHAVMERIDGGYQLRDLGSTNGIKLDGEKHEIIPLRHGLSVKIGDVAFDFTLTEEEREALAREKPPQESPIVKEEAIKGAGAAKPAGGPARPAPAPVARQVIYETQPSASASFFMTLFFLVLAAGAFWLGLSMRYSTRNKGASLMHDLQGSAAGVPIPAPEAKPADGEAAPAPAPEPAE
jgi:pSer/pThr/pTyr-binding forkhead associated (FHA) protein